MGKITKLENRGESVSHSSFEYKYDLTGNIVSEITIQDDVTHTRTFTYDNRSQLTSTTDNNGYYTKYYTYEYDKNGNRIRAIESKGKNVTKDTKYYYDAADKMLKAADTVHWETRTTTYSYDKNGNLKKVNMPFGAEMTYDYNVENRLTAIHDKEHLLMAALYDGNGDRIFTVTNKEDTSGWHDDGNNGQWNTLRPGGDYDDGTWHPDTSSADDGSWKPDVSSNTSSNDGQWKPDVSSNTSSETTSSDTSSTNDGQWRPEPGGNGQWNPDGQWRPDSNNNGQWKPDTSSALTSSVADGKVNSSGNNGQWNPDVSSSPSYDNGQWKPDVSSTSSVDNGQWNPAAGNNGQWKPDVSSSTSSEATSSEASSETSSETTSSEVSSETTSSDTSSEAPKDENSGIPDVELAKGDWSNFAYDRDMLTDTVLIPNGLNEWNEERYEMTGYINDINQANTQVLMEYHDKGYAGNIYEYGVKRESVSHWQNTNYYAYDGRGSVSDLVDGAGEVQMYHSYEPDGQTTLRFRGYIKNPYRYNAERVDYVPGIADFQYLRARYYRPDLARFISQDIVWGTITTPLSQNLFIYVQNNPVNMTDPSGHRAMSNGDGGSSGKVVKDEDYYNDRISQAVNNYMSIEGYINKVPSQMDKMYMQSQMRMFEKNIASYEKELSKLTGNPVSDSIELAKISAERKACAELASNLNELNGSILIVQNDGQTPYEVTFNMPYDHLEALVRMTNIKGVNPTIILSIIAHESGYGATKVNPKAVGKLGHAQGYMQVMELYYFDNLNNPKYSEIKAIAYEYGKEDINANMLNPYGNMAAGINAMLVFRDSDKIGEENMLAAMRGGYKGYMAESSQQNQKEFLDIKKQLDELLIAVKSKK